MAADAIGSMKNDRCGSYQIDQLGLKSIKPFGSNFANIDEALAYCWK